MKYLKNSLLAGLVALTPPLYADVELPNFEVALGGGLVKSEPMFNIDLTINMPISERFSTAINLDSDYVFDDPIYEDYSTSEFNVMGFYRHDNWRIGGGFGVLEKESRDDSFAAERVGIGHAVAAYYWQEMTLDWRYANYNEDFDRAVSMELGAVWYPDDNRRLAIYAEDQERGTGWRVEAFFQPEKHRQRVAYGAIFRDGKGAGFPYLGAELRYYFDRSFSIKQRDRLFH
ncbi:hypothetical protein MAQ5080_00495 [Marinomonas aquimarina]|uniref:Uncharacterized protein n=1 Tax=Marinomonas aquimarina TaxID=295068 RepID=A0A1A8T580_9GAMM|nr:hypothetical protein [Marinomonas aquimarina]SBS26347.1 hypothetical protein MAQ5080_00495 [Marinomonas aquimarina]